MSMRSTQKLLCVGLLLILILLAGCSPSAKVTELLQEENYDEAVAQYNAIEEPDNSINASFIEKLNDIYEDFKNNTIDYTAATAKIASVSKINNTSIQTECTNTIKKIDALNDSRTAFETAVAFEKEKNYRKAIEQYSLVIEDDENYDAAVEKITSCSNALRDEVVTAAEKLVKNNDYESALKTLVDALKVLPNDKDITQSITVYTETFVNGIISQADGLIKEKKLDEAESILKDALDVVPNNQAINEKLDEIDNLRPVGLDTVHVIDNVQYKYVSDGIIDTLGNVHTGVHYFENAWTSKSFDREPYAIFNLNKEYKRFKGTIFLPERTQAKEVFYVNIYADNNLLYSENNIKKTDDPVDFNIDVNNCKQLTIKVGVAVYWSNSYEDVCIANAVLEKI